MVPDALGLSGPVNEWLQAATKLSCLHETFFNKALISRRKPALEGPRLCICVFSLKDLHLLC